VLEKHIKDMVLWDEGNYHNFISIGFGTISLMEHCKEHIDLLCAQEIVKKAHHALRKKSQL